MNKVKVISNLILQNKTLVEKKNLNEIDLISLLKLVPPKETSPAIERNLQLTLYSYK